MGRAATRLTQVAVTADAAGIGNNISSDPTETTIRREEKAKMTRTIGSAMTVVAVFMAAGCTMDVASSARESVAAAERPQASEPLFSPLGSADVLIFGDQVTQINTLRARLQALGHNVTVRTGFDLPATIEELSQFQTVWHIGRNAPLSSGQQALLSEYLSIGGAIHLTGEGFGSGAMNNSLTVFVRSVVENSSTITLGNPQTVPGNPGFYFNVNENAVGGVANSPNTVRSVELVGAGGIAGIAVTSPNTLIFGGSSFSNVVGAIWDSSSLVGDAGKLSLIMDSEWLNRLNGVNDNAELLQNLQDHMTGDPFINQPPQAVAVLPPGQDLDCNDGNNNPRESVPVRLDGSGSTDPDNAPQPLTFTWFENGENIATGPTPTVNLTVGEHVITLLVSDGEVDSFATVTVQITCTIECTPGSGLFNRCHPGCQCDHGEGDCDTDNDCLPGLVCLHDPGAAFGYEDDEVDVCSNVCPTLGIGAWNYCSPGCPCDVGEGDCESDADCLPGLRCVSDIGPSFGFQREVDVCEPR
jgi:hypothetical protein